MEIKKIDIKRTIEEECVDVCSDSSVLAGIAMHDTKAGDLMQMNMNGLCMISGYETRW